MTPLQANDLIAVREVGDGQDPVERAVTILARAFPGESAGTLRRLSLGRRNALLHEVRERLFGTVLEAYAECPHCGEALEFSLNTAGFSTASPESQETELALETDGYAVRFRLLDSRDLQAAANAAGVEAARALLLGRCLLEARYDDRVLKAGELPATVIDRLAQRMEACDPQADTMIELVCPLCERACEIAFDIASFLYTEIHAQALRLLREVHTLARAYAWTEADILAMSARRRRDYLELLLQ